MKKLFKIILLIYFLLGVICFFYNDNKIYEPFLYPSFKHLLGTNSFGRDLFKGLFASNLSLFLMAIFGYISFCITVFLGSIQGYLKGEVDFILQRFYEVMVSIPFFYVLILLSGYFELNILGLGLLLICFNWVFLLPLARVQALKISKYSYIIQMQCVGYSKKRILFYHIIPNVFYNIKPLAPFVLILFISSLASFDFLGLSNKANISVGSLIFEGINNLNFPLILICGCVFMIILLVSLVGIFEVNKYYD